MSNLELNKGDNFIFGIDVSGSMQTKDCPGNTSRIEFLKENVITFAKEASKWDEDGIDIIPFGETAKPQKGVSAENAATIIGALKATHGMTDTAALIREAYSLHQQGGYKQTVLFVATDGEPSDRGAVKEEIRKIAANLKDEHEFAISILTVGNIDPGLRDFLTELDDTLNAKFDIVDVKALTEVDFMTAFSGALHD